VYRRKSQDRFRITINVAELFTHELNYPHCKVYMKISQCHLIIKRIKYVVKEKVLMSHVHMYIK